MISINIDAKVRKEVAQKLNVLLADETVLYMKTLKCHWNVYGKHFGALHAFFKEQYEALFIFMDDVAERVRAVDEFSIGTLDEVKKLTHLSEHPGKDPHDLAMIEWLLKDHEAIICYLREEIDSTQEMHDMGTSNFLTDLMEKHEKMAWMLRAHLKN